MADWEKIKAEYITGNLSYHCLSRKYGLAERTVERRAGKEGWVAERKKYRQKVLKKSLSQMEEKKTGEIVRIGQLADRALKKLEKAIEEVDLDIICHREEEKEDGRCHVKKYQEASPGGIVDERKLKRLTAAMRDLRAIQGVQSELDRMEQESRIALMQKKTRESDSQQQVVLVMEGMDPFGQ